MTYLYTLLCNKLSEFLSEYMYNRFSRWIDSVTESRADGLGKMQTEDKFGADCKTIC